MSLQLQFSMFNSDRDSMYPHQDLYRIVYSNIISLKEHTLRVFRERWGGKHTQNRAFSTLQE